MGFLEDARELDAIINRYSGTNKNHDDLLAEIRDCLSQAGGLLLEKIRGGPLWD